MASVVLACACTFSPVVNAAETVESLRYGVSLYHFYQRDYFNALTELMVGQSEDSLGNHAGGAELLRGGMALSYGMDREAETIFTRLLDDNEHNVDADQAWFYLGKLAWQRGDAARTSTTLARMDEHYDGGLRNEALYLQASAHLALGDSDAGLAHLAALPEDSYWRAYLNYNLGAQAAGFEDWGLAEHYFSAVTFDEQYNPETAALRDKSMTARGYAHLAAGDFDFAGDAFRQVTLEGTSAPRALLGYGWAYAEGGDYLAALTPWQTLSERSLLEPSAR
ncbi:MAG: tetratricopeptide repeat protein, partial [Halioglobus sp.]|nr:tetratricopeptide repeat protein [Halioglobus sp.]